MTLPRVEWLFRPVDRIPQDRVADIRHVHPDLVRPARLQPALHPRKPVKPLKHPPVGDGGLAVFLRDAHTLAVRPVPSDGRVHGAGILSQIPGDYALVCP